MIAPTVMKLPSLDKNLEGGQEVHNMKIAAIFARVSTETKQEPSLDSQVADVEPWLEGLGWTVPPERIIAVHWTSKNILACPGMQKLLKWVRNHEVGAVGSVHLDRFACRMGQMSQILDIFREGGVELLLKNSPLQAGLLGEAMAMVMTIAKAFQVERADEGSKDGLHDRARRLGLPTTCQPPYGYCWNDTRTELLPTTQWDHRRLIVRLYLEGIRIRGTWEVGTIHGIKRDLHERGICSPRGLEWWPDPTIWGILTDHVNCGEYQALKRESVEPNMRRGKRNGEPTYGKTSSRRVQGIHLPSIKVHNPVCTRDEQAVIDHRLEQNRLHSRRNGKQAFLLRGWIKYEVDGRTYRGRYIRDGLWAYTYPSNGYLSKNHPRLYINGPRLEELVEGKASELLASEAVLEHELRRKEQTVKESVVNLEKESRDLERRRHINTNAETQLLLDRSQHLEEISDEAFTLALARIHSERARIDDRQKEVKAQVEDLRRSVCSLVGLAQLREQLKERLASKEFADRRFVLEVLGTQVKVTAEGRIVVEFTVPNEIPKDDIALSSQVMALLLTRLCW